MRIFLIIILSTTVYIVLYVGWFVVQRFIIVNLIKHHLVSIIWNSIGLTYYLDTWKIAFFLFMNKTLLQSEVTMPSSCNVKRHQLIIGFRVKTIFETESKWRGNRNIYSTQCRDRPIFQLTNRSPWPYYKTASFTLSILWNEAIRFVPTTLW